MKIKMSLMFALLAFASQSIAQETTIEQGSRDMLQPYAAQTGCSHIPPNGYIVSAVFAGNASKNCGGSAVGGYLGYYVYESYFDKPVGTQMNMCQGAYSIPDGWYQVGTTPTPNCFNGQSQALVIQRYS